MADGFVPSCDVGSRFRSAGKTFFGQETETWEVVSISQGMDGLLYARMVHLRDVTRTKTIAVTALLDRRLYTPA